MVNIERQTVRDAENARRRVFDEVGRVRLCSREDQRVGDSRCDLIIQATSGEAEFLIAIEAKTRITPQNALSVAERMRQLPPQMLAVVYAPVISPRAGGSFVAFEPFLAPVVRQPARAGTARLSLCRSRPAARPGATARGRPWDAAHNRTPRLRNVCARPWPPCGCRCDG